MYWNSFNSRTIRMSWCLLCDNCVHSISVSILFKPFTGFEARELQCATFQSTKRCKGPCNGTQAGQFPPSYPIVMTDVQVKRGNCSRYKLRHISWQSIMPSTLVQNNPFSGQLTVLSIQTWHSYDYDYDGSMKSWPLCHSLLILTSPSFLACWDLWLFHVKADRTTPEMCFSKGPEQTSACIYRWEFGHVFWPSMIHLLLHRPAGGSSLDSKPCGFWWKAAT